MKTTGAARKRAASEARAASTDCDSADGERKRKRKRKTQRKGKRTARERLPLLTDDSDDEDGPGDLHDGEDEPVAEYERMRSDIQRERQVKYFYILISYPDHTPSMQKSHRRHAPRGQDERTADIRQIFTLEEERQIGDGGVERGHWCEVCKCVSTILKICVIY